MICFRSGTIQELQIEISWSKNKICLLGAMVRPKKGGDDHMRILVPVAVAFCLKTMFPGDIHYSRNKSLPRNHCKMQMK